MSSARTTLDGTVTEATTLGDEHAALMQAVRRRADAALALIDAQVWPAAEIETLARFLHTAVLRQASDEEVLLYPHGASAPFAELTDDHVYLHELTERLDRVEVWACSLTELRDMVDTLLGVLRRHLATEEAVLAALADGHSQPPGTTVVAAGTGPWLPAGPEPVYMELGPAPSDTAVQACIERLLRLRPGECAEIRSDHDDALPQICRWLSRFDAAGYGVEHLRAGTADAALRVTRRDRT